MNYPAEVVQQWNGFRAGEDVVLPGLFVARDKLGFLKAHGPSQRMVDRAAARQRAVVQWTEKKGKTPLPAEPAKE